MLTVTEVTNSICNEQSAPMNKQTMSLSYPSCHGTTLFFWKGEYVGIAPYETFRDFEFMFRDFGFCHLVDRKFRDRESS